MHFLIWSWYKYVFLFRQTVDFSLFFNCSLDIRETAFVYAITAAGALHAVTKACSQGALPQCGCVTLQSSSETYHDSPAEEVLIQASPVQDGRWEWGGCGDDVDFGYEKSRQFMDTRQRKGRSDIRTLIDQHNNEAGRQVHLHLWVWLGTHFTWDIVVNITFAIAIAK